MNNPNLNVPPRQNGSRIPAGLPAPGLPSHLLHRPSPQGLPAQLSEQRNLFTFNPQHNFQFLDVMNSGVSLEVGKPGPSPCKPRDASLTELLESTAIGESFKKNLEDAAKRTPRAVVNSAEAGATNSSLIAKNRPEVAGKDTHVRRARSVTVGSFEDYLRTTTATAHPQVVDQKVDWIKNGNISGQKVLNVQLSRDYIQSYKQSQSPAKESPPQHSGRTSLERQLEEGDPTVTPKKDTRHGSIPHPTTSAEAIRSGLEASEAKGKTAPIPARLSGQALPAALKSTVPRIPSALETVYQRKVTSSAQKTSRSRPRVFDYMAYLQGPQQSSKPVFLGKSHLSKQSERQWPTLSGASLPEFGRHLSQK